MIIIMIIYFLCSRLKTQIYSRKADEEAKALKWEWSAQDDGRSAIRIAKTSIITGITTRRFTCLK